MRLFRLKGLLEQLEQPEWLVQRTEQLQSHWAVVHRNCTDRASRTRLRGLLRRLSSSDRGAFESALAELELASLLIGAGWKVGFLPESQARTADLECRGSDKPFVVEVTALVGSPGLSRRWPLSSFSSSEEEAQPPVLLDRLVARVVHKGRQLAGYCTPVLLAIIVPKIDPRLREPWRSEALLDLKQLAGTMTLMLMRVPQLSGVMLSLWDVEPAEARSGIRLANVHVVERASHERDGHPRIRMLVINPSAGFPLSAQEQASLRDLL